MLSHVSRAGGKIELTVNCSCLGNGEEEKAGWEKKEREKVGGRIEERKIWLALVLAGFVVLSCKRVKAS